jgi:preprotein translocase subunit SecB
MIVKESKFVLENFLITGINWKCIPQESISDKLSSIPIEIDFDIFEAKEDDRKFKIVLIISSGNNDEKRPGYHFSVLSEGYFEITDKIYDTKKEIKDNYLLLSAVPIMINSIRLFLVSVSSNGPFGKWLLPTIDIHDLVSQKVESYKKIKHK